jgi:hypothetical protein
MMSFKTPLFVVFLLPLTILATSGCDSSGDTGGPVTHSVKGKLTQAGQPLAGVVVTFTSGETSAGGATTGEDGTYEARIPAGSYTVTLSMDPPETPSIDPDAPSPEAADPGAAGLDPVVDVELPFSSDWTDPATSPKKNVVVSEGENTIDIAVE